MKYFLSGTVIKKFTAKSSTVHAKVRSITTSVMFQKILVSNSSFMVFTGKTFKLDKPLPPT
jgi:hypothetical protein